MSLSVILMVGVNGVGKTTTIGKLAARLMAEGKTVMLAAGDTFRAGAIDQLVVWGERAGVEVIGNQKVLIQQQLCMMQSVQRKTEKLTYLFAIQQEDCKTK